ncbi:hypothetical protein [Terrisporobacter sp.]|uniref:hypothetical protein n=1 Tax=Terrisporobacter sp. TaxID=1965305 RepID=UPI002610D226|nr:hypothetical protein [Terrisporobacter sp.]
MFISIDSKPSDLIYAMKDMWEDKSQIKYTIIIVVIILLINQIVLNLYLVITIYIGIILRLMIASIQIYKDKLFRKSL